MNGLMTKQEQLATREQSIAAQKQRRADVKLVRTVLRDYKGPLSITAWEAFWRLHPVGSEGTEGVP